MFILLLTSGFTAAAQQSPTLSDDVRDRVVASASQGAPIVSEQQVEELMTDAGAEPDAAADVARLYAETQLEALRQSLFLVFALTVLGLLLSTGLPSKIPDRAFRKPEATAGTGTSAG